MEKSCPAVPSYYFENNYLDSRVDLIRDSIAKASDADVFFLITDLHFSKNAKNSPALIKYISDRIDIPRMFVLGDTDEYGLTSDTAATLRSAFAGKIAHALGGHDYMNGVSDEKISEITTHDHIDVSGSLLRNYFYSDDPEKKLRYIVINGYQAQNGNEGWKSIEAFETEQLVWLENTALSMQGGYRALIFTHALYTLDISHNRMLAIDSPGYSDVLRIITDHADQIAAVFQGHAHRDRCLKIGGRVPLIASSGDMNIPWIAPCGTANIEVDRKSGTIREQSFDVVIHDKSVRRFTLVRIGGAAKDDRLGYCEKRVVLY